MFHCTFWSRLELWLHVHLYHFAESCFISLNWHIVFASGVHSAFFFSPDPSSFALRFEFENYRYEFKICLRASIDFLRLHSHVVCFFFWFLFISPFGFSLDRQSSVHLSIMFGAHVHFVHDEIHEQIKWILQSISNDLHSGKWLINNSVGI